MNRTIIKLSALVGLMGLGACEKDLTVVNPNSPETARVLATPADMEALLGAYYKRFHAGLYQNLGNIHGMANMLAFQNYSSLANNCQNARTQFTGISNTNNPGNVCATEQQRVYFVEQEVTRVASSILTVLNKPAFTLGSTAQDARARAFSEFLRGVSMGYVAMFYDSGAVVSSGADPVDPGKLVGYQTLMDSAFVALERSITAASDLTVTGVNGFPLPPSWIPSPTSFTGGATGNFVRLVRSYRARLLTNVGRTAAERAAPCIVVAGARTCNAVTGWNYIIADAQNGITADHLNTTSTTNGPFYTWGAQYDTYGLWHQMPAFIIGMADGSGVNYDAWVKLDISARSAPFFMQTPDLRFPQGTTRAAQNTDFAISSCQGAAQTCKRYFVNRTAGGDQSVGAGWGFSNYDWVRYHSWRVAGSSGTGQNGDISFFTKAELNLIEAEGQFKLGNLAAAAAIVNVTRGVAGLAPMPANNTTCATDGVPRVPNGAGPTATLACGTLFEALKYEKRIETAYTHFAAWFLDGRGWGDLANGTPLYWATPYQDLQARGVPIAKLYGTGPASNPSNAAGSATSVNGTYGY